MSMFWVCQNLICFILGGPGAVFWICAENNGDNTESFHCFWRWGEYTAGTADPNGPMGYYRITD